VIRALLMAAVVLAATANGGVAAERYPVFDVTHLDHRLAHVSSVLFDVRDFELEAAPASIVITAPPGYTFAHADANEMIIIAAKPAGGGPDQRAVATLGAPTAVSVCEPGEHDLTWDAHAGSLSIPFAVDRTTASTRLIVCLDGVRATGFRVTEVSFGVSLRTPAKTGQYRFSALIAPSTGPAYELRAFADLPRQLTSKATYSTATKTLTVSGKLLAENKPAAGRVVWVSTQYPSVLRDRALGTAVTRSDGTYVLTTKTAEPPPAVGTFVSNVYEAGCHAKSSAPGGCRSESLDSIQNNDIAVAVHSRG
jgi:hypothetical protein